MSDRLKICDVDPEVIEKAKKFRFRKEKTTAAIIMKIDVDKKLVILDEEHESITWNIAKTEAQMDRSIHKEMQLIVDHGGNEEDISVDDLREELPDHLPRYVLYSYVLKHDDGRISYPLVFIFISPQGAKPELQMMYAGSKTNLVQNVGATKDFELRSKEEMSEEWLIQKLKFFR